MSDRLAAEKAELEAIFTFVAGRNFKNAGDAAELKASLAAVQKELADLKKASEAKPEETADAAGP